MTSTTTMYNIRQGENINEDTVEYKYRQYNPVTGTNLNQGGEIRIVI